MSAALRAICTGNQSAFASRCGAARILSSRCSAKPHNRLLCTMATTKGESTLPTELAQSFREFVVMDAKVILGTASKTRRAIMQELASEFSLGYEVLTADIDEKAIRADVPEELVMKLAVAKAEAIKKKLAESSDGEPVDGSTYLLTCDQVVVHDGRVMEKPVDEAEAREFITSFATSPPATVGSVLCTHLPSGRTSQAIDRAEAHISAIPDDVIDRLIEEGSVFYSAGGLMVEHPLVSPYVTKITGGMDTIMGLSKRTTVEVLTGAWRAVSAQE